MIPPPFDDDGSQVIARLLQALETHHPPTYQHSLRVGALTRRLGTALGLVRDEIGVIALAATLHDIGKLTLPVRFLNNRTTLSHHDLLTVRASLVQARDLLSSLPPLEGVSRLVASVHERYDGTGYPASLVGADIPYGARMIAVADAFDAMTHREWGPPRLSPSEALQEIVRHSGNQFDPAVVGGFVAILAAEHPLPRRSWASGLGRNSRPAAQ
jgi:putative two-component system response regulator